MSRTIRPPSAGACGLLPLDKPVGPTSHDVVATARRALGERRIGHTGTLDPFASGLLLLLVGPATRLSEYLTGLDKTYEASARLGVATDTLDREGEVLERDDAWRDLGENDVRRALAAFVGRQMQTPPLFSAKKVRGEAAHRRVRRGESVELEPAEVEVHEIELLGVALPEVRFRLRCSSGTYVRAVARDLGRALGTGAHLTELRRTAVGGFHVDDALPGRVLESAADGPGGTGRADGERAGGEDAAAERGGPERIGSSWIPAADALRHLPVVVVGESEERDLGHGRPIPLPGSGAGEDATEPPEGAPVALVRAGRLLAVGERRGARVQPRKVFSGG